MFGFCLIYMFTDYYFNIVFASGESKSIEIVGGSGKSVPIESLSSNHITVHQIKQNSLSFILCQFLESPLCIFYESVLLINTKKKK